MTTTTERRRRATRKFMLRVAELKIKIHGLKDTPEEYVQKCQEENRRGD